MNQTATLTDHTVAVYATHEQAHDAIKLLSKSGYDMRHLSIIGQDYATEEQPVGFINRGDRMLSWGKLGAFWGAIWGLLFGAAFMVLPGLGIFMFAGWLVGAVETSIVAGGLAALGGCLASIGIPKDSVVEYESALKAGSFLVVAHGTPAEVAGAKESLGTTGVTSLQSFGTRQPVGVL